MTEQNAIALITGAGSGLGEATARLLRDKGYDIALLDVQMDKAEQVAEAVDGIAVHCDVTDPVQVETAIAEIQTLGQLRVCVNCAGVIAGERIVGREAPMPLQNFSRVIDINLIGTFNVMRVASFAMSQLEPYNDDGERGVIINTASVAAFEGQLGQAAYSASKGGVASMTLPAARELASFGIRVVTIAPGLFATPMMEGVSEEVHESLLATTLFPKRLGKPEEYAEAVFGIIKNSLINGSVIRLDGGVRLPRK